MTRFPAPSILSLRRIGLVMVVFGLGSGAAHAQATPDGENGRYAFQPAAEGVLRLDTRNGTVSTCADKGSGWACYTVPDERSAYDAEIGRLQRDNEQLRAKLAQTGTVAGKIDESLPKAEPLPKQDSLRKPEITSKDGERKLEIPLPNDREINQVMAFLETAWRRLVEMANRVQKDVSGKI